MAPHEDDNMGDENYRGVDRRRRERWHLKREISTGDLLVAAGILGGLLLWGRGIESRLLVIEKAQEMQARIDQQQDSIVRESVLRIEQSMRDINLYLLKNGAARLSQ